jgi:hypothetical protein
MSTWKTRPDPDDRSYSVPLTRCPPDRSICGIITSREIAGRDLHYWQGRTRPCEHPTCDACDAGRKPRWYGYVSIYHPRSHAIAIFELTPACDPAIQAYLTEHGTIRGAKLTLRRSSTKLNGKILAELEPGSYDGTRLPEPVDVRAILHHIWEIAPPIHVHIGQETNAVAPNGQPPTNKNRGRGPL